MFGFNTLSRRVASVACNSFLFPAPQNFGVERPELKKLCYICIRNNLKVKANLYATNKLATIAAMQ